MELLSWDDEDEVDFGEKGREESMKLNRQDFIGNLVQSIPQRQQEDTRKYDYGKQDELQSPERQLNPKEFEGELEATFTDEENVVQRVEKNII